jgi:hypothetical protein
MLEIYATIYSLGHVISRYECWGGEQIQVFKIHFFGGVWPSSKTNGLGRLDVHNLKDS